MSKAKKLIDSVIAGKEIGSTINNLLEEPGWEADDNNEIPDWLVKQYEERAEAEREAGGSIEINSGLPYIDITMSDGSVYTFQEHEADELLNEVPDNISAEDYILAQAQNW